MTIELVTGNPGAGKTTYAVAVRLVHEERRTIPLELESCMALGVEPGTVVPRRICQAGIKGLVLPHEKLPHTLTGDRIRQADIDAWNAVDADGELKMKRLPTEPPVEGVEASFFNWWLWCKPGDLIVVDEVQYIVPRGSLGKKPPPYIALLEIHRHYGVDFLFITQHPQLIDPTIRALVGMHRHVRSVMGSAVCLVYVWDHASNPERYTNANKEKFIRRAAHYRLFRSAVAHVKPPSSGRWALWAVPLLVGVFALGFTAKVRAWMGLDKPGVAAAAAPGGAGSGAPLSGGAPAGAPPGQAPATSGRPQGWGDTPVVRGCVAGSEGCRCIGDRGDFVRVAERMCRLSAGSFDGLVVWEPSTAKRFEGDKPSQSEPAEGRVRSSALPSL